MPVYVSIRQSIEVWDLPPLIRVNDAPVHEVEIEIIEMQIPKRRFARGAHIRACVLGIPQFARDEDLLTPQQVAAKNATERLADFLFVLVNGRAINVSVAAFRERIFTGLPRPA